MKRFITVVLVAGALAGVSRPAGAAMQLDAWRGHISIGYTLPLIDALAPGGSMSAGVGVDYPLAPAWRVGPAVSLNMLGSSQVTRGSITASLDYGIFEGALLFTHVNANGPIARWSVGPGVASPNIDLSVGAGGAGFSDLTVGGIRPELAADATLLMSRRMPIVAVGLELGARVVPVPSRATWVLLSARFGVHF